MADREMIRAVDVGRSADVSIAARKRAAVELIRRHERTLRRTARRYSLCGDDAEDALQRALEILLTKAPTSDQRQLIRWMQTVTKHEALAVRRNRERQLGTPAAAPRDEGDWVQLIPSEKDGPADTAERRELVARAREALKALKPQELRALTLLAEGYSYAEIGQITGWTYTKINRCLAEGRQRFRAVIGSIEEGRRCEELAPTLSAFADGEATSRFTEQLRAHLKECGHCRATLRAYRAAPQAAAALAPLPADRVTGGRLHDLVASLHSRLPGRSGAAEATVSQFAASGGTRGSGMALAAKILTACVGTAGGAAACVATGVLPPAHVIGGTPSHHVARTIHRDAPAPAKSAEAAEPVPTVTITPDPPVAQPAADPAPAPQPPPQPSEVSAEFGPEPPPAPAPATPASNTEFGGSGATSSSSSGGSSGGSGSEFGP